MSDMDQVVLGIATLAGAVGMWLMLPGGGGRGRVAGAILALTSLVLFASQLPRFVSPSLAGWESDSQLSESEAGQLAEVRRETETSEIVFFVLAGVTVVAAACAVTFRSPVYCAIWFALSLLGTAGLFLFQGAQFLGVATIVVYAGAILVTFLFVLMLAQPRGFAFYDRLSWERLLSASTGALMTGVLTLTVVSVFQKQPRVPFFHLVDRAADAADLKLGLRPPADPTARAEQILSPEHVAHLGGQLFSRQLVAVEVAGTLLLVALVGAIAIAAQVESLRPRTRQGVEHHG